MFLQRSHAALRNKTIFIRKRTEISALSGRFVFVLRYKFVFHRFAESARPVSAL